MPRPRMTEPKAVRLTTRFTEAEAGALHAHANDAGVTVSDLMRSALLNYPLPEKRRRRRPQPVHHADELAAILRHIGAIGSNVNQLARTANMGSWPEADAINDARSDIRWIRQTLMRALGMPESEPTPP